MSYLCGIFQFSSLDFDSVLNNYKSYYKRKTKHFQVTGSDLICPSYLKHQSGRVHLVWEKLKYHIMITSNFFSACMQCVASRTRACMHKHIFIFLCSHQLGCKATTVRIYHYLYWGSCHHFGSTTVYTSILLFFYCWAPTSNRHNLAQMLSSTIRFTVFSSTSCLFDCTAFRGPLLEAK